MTRQECIRLNLAVINDPAIGHILEKHAFELTRCRTCDSPEFVHDEGCALAEEVETLAGKSSKELGPLVYFS